MGTLGRILLVVVTFSAAAAAIYVLRPRLGIEPGTLQSAMLFGVIVGLASLVWRMTAPTDRPPSQSN
jgi:hypothetical protein